MATSDQDIPEFARKWVNLADARRGAIALSASDEFFAHKERMLNPSPPYSSPEVRRQRQMDGRLGDAPQTRRGLRYCIVRLAYPGIIRGVDIDTRHFTGNYPPAASIEDATRSGP